LGPSVELVKYFDRKVDVRVKVGILVLSGLIPAANLIVFQIGVHNAICVILGGVWVLVSFYFLVKLVSPSITSKYHLTR
jgi:hypothetical protein